MFSEILRLERKKLGLTQEQLAKKLNVSRSNVANWENGSNTATQEMLNNLANFFDCSTDYLLGRTNCRNIKEQIQNYLNTNEYKNHQKIIQNINDDLTKELKLNEFYMFTEEQVNSNLELPKDNIEILLDKLKDLQLLNDNKELDDKQLNVILNFIENNKDMLKTLINNEQNKQ